MYVLLLIGSFVDLIVVDISAANSPCRKHQWMTEQLGRDKVTITTCRYIRMTSSGTLATEVSSESLDFEFHLLKSMFVLSELHLFCSLFDFFFLFNIFGSCSGNLNLISHDP